MEYRVIGADGEIRWIEATGTAMHRPDGSIELIVGVMMMLYYFTTIGVYLQAVTPDAIRSRL